MIHITDHTDHKYHMIDNIYKVFIIENVVQYSLINFNTHQIEVCNSDEKPVEYYFAIDLLFHDAFSHWVYESAIYLPIFSKLKEIYPTIKILLKEKKQFKLLFLKFFNIMETDIVYDIQPRNVCLFPSPISALNENNYFTDTYKQILLQFITIFSHYNLSNECRAYDYIILPRQTKENYKSNDRSYHMELTYEAVRTISQNYDTLHTDTIVDLKDQIAAVQSAPNVILTDRSPFMVNNLFCNNQKLFVLDTITIQQLSTYIKFNYIREMVCRLHHNSYTYIPTYLVKDQIIELLNN